MHLDLPGRKQAVLLATVGFAPVRPQWSRNDRTGAMTVRWRLEGSGVSTAQQLLESLDSPDPRKNPAQASPEHGVLACLYWQEAGAALAQWLKTGTAPLCLKAGPVSRLLRLLPHSPALAPHHLEPVVWPSDSSASAADLAAIADPAHAAVAVICGFVPRASLDLSPGHPPRFVFRKESLTFPGLRIEDLAGAQPGSLICTHPAGEHPACYALAAAINTADFAAAEETARRNPIHMFKARGRGSALMTENLLTHAPRLYRDKLARHLAIY